MPTTRSRASADAKSKRRTHLLREPIFAGRDPSSSEAFAALMAYGDDVHDDFVKSPQTRAAELQTLLHTLSRLRKENNREAIVNEFHITTVRKLLRLDRNKVNALKNNNLQMHGETIGPIGLFGIDGISEESLVNWLDEDYGEVYYTSAEARLCEDQHRENFHIEEAKRLVANLQLEHQQLANLRASSASGSQNRSEVADGLFTGTQNSSHSSVIVGGPSSTTSGTTIFNESGKYLHRTFFDIFTSDPPRSADAVADIAPFDTLPPGEDDEPPRYVLPRLMSFASVAYFSLCGEQDLPTPGERRSLRPFHSALGATDGAIVEYTAGDGPHPTNIDDLFELTHNFAERYMQELKKLALRIRNKSGCPYHPANNDDGDKDGDDNVADTSDERYGELPGSSGWYDEPNGQPRNGDIVADVSGEDTADNANDTAGMDPTCNQAESRGAADANDGGVPSRTRPRKRRDNLRAHGDDIATGPTLRSEAPQPNGPPLVPNDISAHFRRQGKSISGFALDHIRVHIFSNLYKEGFYSENGRNIRSVGVITMRRRFFLGVPEQVVRHTYENTTHHYRNIGVAHNIIDTHASPFPANSVPHLHERLYTDTLISDTRAWGGYYMAQLFAGRSSYFVFIRGMVRESEFPDALMDFIRKYGAPDKLCSDRAQAEISKRVLDILRMYRIDDWQSEPHFQWQNFAERIIQEIKKYINWILNFSGAPAEPWYLALRYVVYIWNRTARERLGWRTPYEVLLGNTPDISVLLHFEFWERVLIKNYREPGTGFPSESSEIPVRFVGFSDGVGHNITFAVSNEETNQLLYRSRVKKVKSAPQRNRHVMPDVTGEEVPRQFLDPVLPEEVIGETAEDAPSPVHDDVEGTLDPPLAQPPPEPPPTATEGQQETVPERVRLAHEKTGERYLPPSIEPPESQLVGRPYLRYNDLCSYIGKEAKLEDGNMVKEDGESQIGKKDGEKDGEKGPIGKNEEGRVEFKLKGTGELNFQLGCDYIRGKDGVLRQEPKKYIEKMTETYERLFGEKPCMATSPLVKGNHPELDTSDFLDDERTKIYQSMIGAAQWIIQPGRFDIAVHVMTLSSFHAQPCEGHLDRMKRVDGYLYKMEDGVICIRMEMPDVSDLQFAEYDWLQSPYAGTEEEVPVDLPKALRKPVLLVMHGDTNLCHVLHKRHLMLSFHFLESAIAPVLHPVLFWEGNTMNILRSMKTKVVLSLKKKKGK